MHIQKYGMQKKKKKTFTPICQKTIDRKMSLKQRKRSHLRLSLWQIDMFIEWFLITFQQKWMSVLVLRKRDIMPGSIRKAGPYLATGPLDLASCYLLILSTPKSAFKCQQKLDRYLYLILAIQHSSEMRSWLYKLSFMNQHARQTWFSLSLVWIWLQTG